MEISMKFDTGGGLHYKLLGKFYISTQQ